MRRTLRSPDSAQSGRRTRQLAALAVLLAASTMSAGLASAVETQGAARTTGVTAVTVVLNAPSPPSIYEDNVTHLSGTLSTLVPDKLIVLRKLVDDQWVEIARTQTDATGAFAFDLTPVDPGSISLQAMHPRAQGDLESETQTLEVLDRRVFLSSNAAYHTFGNIVMTGVTVPAAVDRPIVIQHLSDGVWVPGASARTDAEGRYAIQMRTDLPGAWTIRAYWAGSNPSGGTIEYSGIHHYTVEAILHPLVTPVTRTQLGASYHTGCPVGPELLRNIGVTFKTFGPLVHRGTIVVRDTIVSRVIGVLRMGLDHGYPIRRMFPAAYYGGSDVVSMNHDNTSAFNCRQVTGDPTRLSPHSYGIAVDIDPVENPYLDVHGTWWPKNVGQQFRNRGTVRPGMLYDGSIVTRAWRVRGFQWGGDWYHPDYQHFDTLGGAPKRPARQVAGPLSADSMPAPAALGAGWHRYVDPGGPQVGWVGNGSFVHARDARSAAKRVLPLGCAVGAPVRSSLPVPRFALQGSYLSRGGAPGQAVVMQFAGARLAATYFAGLERALLGCPSADGPAGVAVRPQVVSGSSYVGQRTYSGHERWAEHDSRAGARVTVLLARR